MHYLNVSPVQFFKCLADSTRLEVLLLLHHHGELTVTELTGAMDQIQPKISRHLAQLRKFRLLEDQLNGPWVSYRLSEELPQWVRRVMDTTLAENQELIAESSARLNRLQLQIAACD